MSPSSSFDLELAEMARVSSAYLNQVATDESSSLAAVDTIIASTEAVITSTEANTASIEVTASTEATSVSTESITSTEANTASTEAIINSTEAITNTEAITSTEAVSPSAEAVTASTEAARIKVELPDSRGEIVETSIEAILPAPSSINLQEQSTMAPSTPLTPTERAEKAERAVQNMTWGSPTIPTRAPSPTLLLSTALAGETLDKNGEVAEEVVYTPAELFERIRQLEISLAPETDFDQTEDSIGGKAGSLLSMNEMMGGEKGGREMECEVWNRRIRSQKPVNLRDGVWGNVPNIVTPENIDDYIREQNRLRGFGPPGESREPSGARDDSGLYESSIKGDGVEDPTLVGGETEGEEWITDNDNDLYESSVRGDNNGAGEVTLTANTDTPARTATADIAALSSSFPTEDHHLATAPLPASDTQSQRDLLTHAAAPPATLSSTVSAGIRASTSSPIQHHHSASAPPATLSSPVSAGNRACTSSPVQYHHPATASLPASGIQYQRDLATQAAASTASLSDTASDHTVTLQHSFRASTPTPLQHLQRRSVASTASSAYSDMSAFWDDFWNDVEQQMNDTIEEAGRDAEQD
ncbi:hypothetical protein MMC12_000022 [Toensbergia leucococca]|nr:hypothetical protein [Toensbergia leucococca]